MFLREILIPILLCACYSQKEWTHERPPEQAVHVDSSLYWDFSCEISGDESILDCFKFFLIENYNFLTRWLLRFKIVTFPTTLTCLFYKSFIILKRSKGAIEKLRISVELRFKEINPR